MTEKPLVLSSDMTLVDHDLSSVFAHYLDQQTPEFTMEVKFKKKEDIGTMAKSVLKHRIQSLTGKNIQALETELGKSIGKFFGQYFCTLFGGDRPIPNYVIVGL